MAPIVAQHESVILSPRFRQRLRELSVPVVRLTAEGGVATEDDLDWIERVIVSSRAFAAAVKTKWPEIGDALSRVTELWPGVSVVALPDAGRRRLDTMRCPLSLHAALMVGPCLVSSEQLHRICDEAQLDYRATVARINPDRLMDTDEARRLALALSWMHEDAGEIDRQAHELQTLSTELADSYEELSLLYKLSTSMVVNQAPAQFLADVCGELQQVVGLRWLAVRLIDNEPRLQGLAGQLIVAGHTGAAPDRFQAVAAELLKRFANATAPVIIDDTTTLGIPELLGSAGSLLVVPLRREDGTLGLMIGGDKLDAANITSVDSKLCDSLANTLTIFLENLMLYEDAQAMFMGTLHALTRAIDAKDSYTHGHSERVALLSRMLAEAVGLDAETVERVYIAGLIHDVGKIGVPEAVLTKPGRLTDDEFDLIKMHPEIGGKILRDIRQMQDLIPGVMYHHERYDGRGYPHGRAGDDIPLFGRLICLADSFDAMSSNRTYRAAMDRQRVLDEIRKCAGTQFDPTLAEAFVNLDFVPFDMMIQKHQATMVGTADKLTPGV